MPRSRVAAFALFAALACGDAPARQVFQVRGVVRGLEPQYSQVLIEHEDIPGLMPAMTMNFDVPDPELFARLEKGQEIDFELAFTGKAYQVIAVQVRGSSASEGPAFPTLAAVADIAPDFALIDPEGRTVSLDSLRGRAVLLDFIYTRCPGPCPIQSARMVRVQRQLEPELRARTAFVSISLDPEYDTPERMRAYAEAHGAELEDWFFLTGPPAQVQRVIEAYGVGAVRVEEGEIQHMLATFLIDPEGRIAERYLGGGEPPEDLLRGLASVL